jgi:hypothetical protein
MSFQSEALLSEEQKLRESPGEELEVGAGAFKECGVIFFCLSNGEADMR